MITVAQYTKDKFDIWNDFVENSNNGTIFHRLDFLAYHGNKFQDNEHHLMFYKDEVLVAVLPLGIFDNEGVRVAKSPYGASWGGLVFSEKLSIKYVVQIIVLFLNYLKDIGVNECIITVTPQCYYFKPTNYFEYSLYLSGFNLINRMNHLVTKLPESPDKVMDIFHSKCRNQTRKGLSLFNTFEEKTNYKNFYPILLEDKVRHNSTPTHSESELEYLSSAFPDNVTFDIGITENNDKAGICYFNGNKNCTLVFYMCQQNKALRLNGMNALVYKGMGRAILNGFKYYDFGLTGPTSVGGKIGVAEFKESFGALGVFRDTYKCKI